MNKILLHASALVLFLASTLAVPLVTHEENDIELDPFAENPEALPNVKGVTDIRGEAGEYKYRIANIVPRECDASFGLKVSYKNGAPTLRVLLASTDAKFEKGKTITNPKSAKLIDLSVDYKIRGTSWLTKWTVHEKGTHDLVLALHVDAEIAYDKASKKWKIDKDQISLKPQGEFELNAKGWLSWLINKPMDVVFNDYVERGLAASLKWFLPNKLPLSLPKYVQDAIESHFEASPETELNLNGQLSWFLPILADPQGTKLLESGRWWGRDDDAAPTDPPTERLASNVLALPISFKEETDKLDYEIGNIVPHRVDVKFDVELRTDGGKPELLVSLGGTCDPTASSASCANKNATLDIDADYFVEKKDFPPFKDSGTVMLKLDTRMLVVLQLIEQPSGKWSWNLKEIPRNNEMTMDVEMVLKNSKLSPIINPILKVVFNDWLEKKLTEYAAKHICPDIPKYIPQQYTNLYGGVLAKVAESKLQFQANLDLTIPRKSTTVYLQDRLAQQL